MTGLSALSFSEIISRAKRNIFPLSLLAALEILFIFYSAGAWPLVLFVIIFFLPGFLVARHFFWDKIEQTAFAFPLSIVLVGVPLYFFSFFYAEAVSWFSIVFAYAITAILCKWVSRSSESTSSPSPVNPSAHASVIHSLPRWVFILLLVAVCLGFFSYVSFVGTGSLQTSYPVGTTAWDKVIHLTWVRGMMETGQTALPPVLSGGLSGVESTYFTPLSIFPLGLFARYAGMPFWSAHDAYFVLVFVFSILGIFVLARRLWNEHAALLASFIGATPLLYYFFSDLAGMYRVGLVVFFTSLIIISLEKFLAQDKNAHILVGIVFAGFLNIHPLSIILFLVYFVRVSRELVLKKMSLSYAAPAAAIALVCFIPFWVSSRADYVFSLILVPFEWMSPLLFDSKTVDLVGPVLRWSTIWTYAFFALLGLILFGWFLRKNISARTSVRMNFLYTTFWLVLLTMGVSNFIFNYAGKWRAVEYFIIFIPLTAYLFWEVLQRIPRFSVKQKVIGGILLILLVQSPLLYASKSFTTKLDSEVWGNLEWVNQNTPPDSKVFSIFGFYQHTHLLSNRPGNYAGASSVIMDYFNGKPAHFPPYCVPGFSRSGFFSIAPVACPLIPSRLEDYDYLLADYLATTRDPSGIGFIHQSLSARGFTLVHVTENIVVYQNVNAPK